MQAISARRDGLAQPRVRHDEVKMRVGDVGPTVGYGTANEGKVCSNGGCGKRMQTVSETIVAHGCAR